MHEAKIDDTPAGRVPADDGWFILNLDEVGTRTSDDPGFYPAEPLAARYGASVGESTADPKQAYAGRPPSAPARSPWPLTGRA
jgi:hypothetical protein